MRLASAFASALGSAATPFMAVVAAALALAGCEPTPPAPGNSLFPLEAGHAWTYRVTTVHDSPAVTERELLTLRTLGTEDIDGVPAQRRRSDGGMDYWLRSDASGIYRVASKSDLDAEPRPDPAPRYVLRAPLVVGTQWQSTTTPYLLERQHEFPRELRHVYPSVPMVYAIEAIDEHVDTEAGGFDGCLRVRGEAQLKLYADAVAGWKPLPLTTIEWYCRGVGLVRLERREPSASSFISGGSVTMELISWH